MIVVIVRDLLPGHHRQRFDGVRVGSDRQPRIRRDLLQRCSTLRLPDEHPRDQTLAGIGDVRRDRVLAVHDHREGFAVIGFLERRLAAD